ncbi:DUF423 domain-containing protein [Gemmatimonadota bacterium]
MSSSNDFGGEALRGRVLGFLGALFGFLAVALGAFGSHGLEGRLPPEALATFETAVRYQMYHALALLVVAWQSRRAPGADLAGWAFVTGILLFSGSLYVLVATGQTWLGAITPMGGLAFLTGWLGLAWSFLKT